MKATIKDVAREAGVSITTVSRVINNKAEGVGKDTRDRIQRIIKELDYTPNHIARGLVMKKTQVIGVIIPDIINPFFPEVIRGMEDTASKLDYNIILCNSDGNIQKEKDYMQLLKDKGVDGIIYTGVNAIRESADLLVASKIPFVCLDRVMPSVEASFVCDDGVYGMYEITKYLISQGHREIAFISGVSESSTAMERRLGYERALTDNGIQLDANLIREGTYTMETGVESARSLLDSNIPFTAIACANDTIAIGAMGVLLDRGIRVPQDVSVVGYDDIILADICNPRLTTMSQKKYEMGQSAVELLIEVIEGSNQLPKAVVLRSQLVIRNSVARRRK